MKVILTSEEELRSIIKETFSELSAQTQKQNEPYSELPEYLNRKETAKLLGISLSKLDILHNEGVLTKVRNGSLVRYKKATVLEFYKSFNKYSRY